MIWIKDLFKIFQDKIKLFKDNLEIDISYHRLIFKIKSFQINKIHKLWMNLIDKLLKMLIMDFKFNKLTVIQIISSKLNLISNQVFRFKPPFLLVL